MKFLISPAKSFNANIKTNKKYNVDLAFPKDAKYFNEQLKKIDQLADFFGVSEKVAETTKEYIAEFSDEMFQAIFLYGGLVYKNLRAHELDEKQLDFLEKHLYIISGMYGLMTPHTNMSKYRLEMRQKLNDNFKSNNLYKYWTEKLSLYLKDNTTDGEIVVNLASNEYVKAISAKIAERKLVNIDFKVIKNNKLKVLATYAKQARGMMLRQIAEKEIQTLDEIKKLNIDGFIYNKEESTEDNFIFVRI